MASDSHIIAERGSSAPYLSGDSFRAYADFVIDETNTAFFPDNIAPGSVIFLRADYLSHFFNEIHPLITVPYILISQNSDDSIPGTFAHFLDDDNIIAWFGQNVEDFVHPKLHLIPIGIANRYWAYGDTGVFDNIKNNLQMYPKSHLVYMNFTIDSTYQECALKERTMVYERFIRQPFCFVAKPKNLEPYLIDLAQSKFVVSPRGKGLDCYRTWEALYMGTFPIVRTSSLDPVYEGLPIVIVNDWSEVTESFLEQKYEELQHQTFQWEKLKADYWFKLIDSYKPLRVL